MSGGCDNVRMGEYEGELESVRVARVLREEIIIGDREPGTRLVERDIAAAMNVSRLPVREAIKQLAAEGMVIAKPRSGAVVRQFTLQDIDDFAELREAIETLTFVLAAKRHTPEGLAALREVIDRQRAAVGADDLRGAWSASSDFHILVTRLAGNAMVNEMVAGMAPRLRWIFGHHEDLAGMVEAHEAIFAAVEQRDTERVRGLVIDHLESGRQEAIERLNARTMWSI